jgi:hypothetical protein
MMVQTDHHNGQHTTESPLEPASPLARQESARPRTRRYGEESDEVKAKNLAELPNRPDLIWSNREDLGLYLPDGWREVIFQLRKKVPDPALAHVKPRLVRDAMGLSRRDEDFLDELDYGETVEQSPWAIEKHEAFRTGEGPLKNLGIGPGKIVLIGGVPKAGKTSLVLQLCVDALRLQDLACFVANAEMSPQALMARQVSRLSGVPVERIAQGNLPLELEERVQEARLELRDPNPNDDMSTLSHSTKGMLESSLQFCKPPWNTLNLARHVSQVEQYSTLGIHQAILVVDYIQLFSAFDRTQADAWRQSRSTHTPPPCVHDVARVMSELRRLASAGVAIVAVSAINKDAYSGAKIGGFRGSSELEYGCDEAFILEQDESRDGVTHLRHVASRHSETRDRILKFEGVVHRFTPLDK